MKEKLDNFRIAKFRFLLKPRDFIKLSSFAGSSLRKDFIPIFKQITCLEPHGDCKSCKMQDDCPYFISLEKGEGIPDPEYKRYQTPPKPFIFEPPLKRKTFYSKNEDLYFDLVLVGKALEFFPFYAAGIRRVGELGIGRNQGKYSLNRILAFDLVNNVIAGEFTFDSDKLKYDEDFSVPLSEIYEKYESQYEEVNEINVSIVTPLRMKRLGNDNWHLYFKSLIKNIVTRIANLGHAYCDFDEFLHFPELIYNAGAVRTSKENLNWEDWRHPAMQNKNPNVRLGGYLGDLMYKGSISDFWPILKIGELIHIGKNTSFGLGRILVELIDTDNSQKFNLR